MPTAAENEIDEVITMKVMSILKAKLYTHIHSATQDKKSRNIYVILHILNKAFR